MKRCNFVSNNVACNNDSSNNIYTKGEIIIQVCDYSVKDFEDKHPDWKKLPKDYDW